MPSVLVVEDDPVALDILELMLMLQPGISVRCVSSVEDAKAILDSGQQAFDAVITDVHLPGEDGLSLVAAIRRMPGGSNFPVIVTTSSREPELRERAEALGVRAFIEKPWSAARLRNTVNSLFNGS